MFSKILPPYNLSVQDKNVCCFPEKLTISNEIIQGLTNSTTHGCTVKKIQIEAYIDLTNVDDGNSMTIFQHNGMNMLLLTWL